MKNIHELQIVEATLKYFLSPLVLAGAILETIYQRRSQEYTTTSEERPQFGLTSKNYRQPNP